MILEFTRGMERAAFLGDLKTQSAALHQFMVVGEAVKRLSPEFRAKHSGIPWSLIAGMRDKLIHHYDSVDFEQVWRSVDTDIPDLLSYVEALAPVAES